jgi:hypothetical protein
MPSIHAGRGLNQSKRGQMMPSILFEKEEDLSNLSSNFQKVDADLRIRDDNPAIFKVSASRIREKEHWRSWLTKIDDGKTTVDGGQ